MRRGDIWLASLTPTQGSEQSGTRPVVIVSGDTLNDTLPIVVVVPITSKIKSYPTCVLLRATNENGLEADAEAIPFQIRALATQRLAKKIGRIKETELQDILRGLFVALTH